MLTRILSGDFPRSRVLFLADGEVVDEMHDPDAQRIAAHMTTMAARNVRA